jgi:predicted RNA-binding Zn-ribbon protein involved in translation (DUF1610 family)
MIEKVFITSNNTATFVCPQCGNVTTANVAKFAAIDKRITVKARCNCGHHFTVSLEKRRQYRKATDLPGNYYHQRNNGDVDKGIMRVVDVSSTGLKLKLNVERHFAVGDRLRVEFHLDDKRRTFFDKQVIVRNVRQNLVGTAFAPGEAEDPNLGFYLMS